MSQITKAVSIYRDSEGWVARCTESDENGPILGRVAMDEPVEYGDEDDAAEFAAEYWGVALEDVARPE